MRGESGAAYEESKSTVVLMKNSFVKLGLVTTVTC